MILFIILFFVLVAIRLHSIANGTNYIGIKSTSLRDDKKLSFFSEEIYKIQSANLTLRQLNKRISGKKIFYEDTKLKTIEILNTFRNEKNEFVIKFKLKYTNDKLIYEETKVFYLKNFKKLCYTYRYDFFTQESHAFSMNNFFVHKNRNEFVDLILKFDGRLRMLKTLNKRNNLKPLSV